MLQSVSSPSLFTPFGEAALLLQSDQASALRVNLEHDPVAGVIEVVPAWHALTLFIDPLVISMPALQQILSDRLVHLSYAEEPIRRLHEIPVRFDGEDLNWCSQQAKLSVSDWIEAFCRQELKVAFLGFTPGFAFLSGLDPQLQVPRKPTPRLRVPAGSVALGGPWAGVYPSASAGGWQLIGHTDAPLLDWQRSEPILWRTGDEVRFIHD